MPDRIVGTAGHIDHGKTALVRALTGIETDRLPEERSRGISIDLGFAHMDDGTGGTVGVVDVPGHEGFIRTMIAGAGGVDLVLLCVAADEGVMPQTREHLEILSLLGVPALIPVLTRVDRADPELADLVEEEVRELLTGTPWPTPPVFRVAAPTGEGIEALRSSILSRLGEMGPRGGVHDLAYLPVDRAFTVHGTGRVVTGTLRSGVVEVGDTLTLFPEGLPVRVRGVERHGAGVARVAAGARAALALAPRSGQLPEIGRGSVLTSPGGWVSTRRLAVRLEPLPGREERVAPGTRVRLLLGTGEVLARIRRVRGTEARLLSLDGPVAARAGERFVIRALSPAETVGGGVILHPEPGARFRAVEGEALMEAFSGDDPTVRLTGILRGAGARGVPDEALTARTGLPPGRIPPAGSGEAAGGHALAGQRFALEVTSNEVCRWMATLEAFHREHPEEVGLPPGTLPDGGLPEPSRRALLTELVEAGRMVWRSGRVALPEHTPRLGGAAEREGEGLAARILEAGSEGWEAESDTPGGILRFLERSGTVAEVAPGRWLHREVESALLRRLREAHPPGKEVSVGEVREALGLSRKYLLPLLERWDGLGHTARAGDARVVLPEPLGKG